MNVSNISEPTTIGLSDEAHAMLRRLAEDKKNGSFAEMADAYRFAIALALAYGVAPEEPRGHRTTIFNVGTLDPDRQVHLVIKALLKTGDTPVYRWAERLAEWGVRELFAMSESGVLDVGRILDKLPEELVE